MKAINPTSYPRSQSSLRLLSVLLLALTLAACTNPVEVTPEDEPPATKPAPAAKLYRVDINFKRIRVVGDCVDDPILVLKGRFSYRLAVSSERPDGSWTAPRTVTETRNYGSKDGDIIKIASGNDITVNKRHTLVLPDGANYRMHMSAIAWDEFGQKDHRMNNDTVTEENNTGGKATYKHGLDLGPNTSCRLKLYVDATETLL